MVFLGGVWQTGGGGTKTEGGVDEKIYEGDERNIYLTYEEEEEEEEDHPCCWKCNLIW